MLNPVAWIIGNGRCTGGVGGLTMRCTGGVGGLGTALRRGGAGEAAREAPALSGRMGPRMAPLAKSRGASGGRMRAEVARKSAKRGLKGEGG